jgi:hypothetical protein
MAADFPEVKEVRRVALGLEDRLVVCLDHYPGDAEIAQFKTHVSDAFGLPPGRVVVAAGVQELSVVGPGSPERSALEDLLALILDEMPAAGNRDMAADGPVGDEEARVWRTIEKLALKFREELFEAEESG